MNGKTGRNPMGELDAAFRELIESGIPFNNFLGLRVRRLEPGRCSLVVPRRPELVGDTRRGALHGGVISMLVDTCGGFAVWTLGKPSDRIATIDLRVDYLKPAVEGDLVAESQVRLHGNRVGNAVTVVYCDTDPGAIVAEGRSVYNIRRA
jgi:uncharacterized protein (TIGR00369 family)